jgi:Heterokaryon incompatibility protein (HET)
MNQTQTYTYTPLEDSEQIRLLTLNPGARNDQIQCSLSTRDLEYGEEWFLGGFVEEGAGYEALSYTWGQSTSRKLISINGATLLVTENLYAALLHLRDEQKPRILWVDAICIDQQNLEERSTQVPLMFRIYGSATRVLVWLGEQSDDSDLALDVIASWSRPSAVLVDRLSTNSIEFKALDNLFARSWWNSSWVVQEVANSKIVEFVIGYRHLPWEDFYHSLLHVHYDEHRVAKDVGEVGLDHRRNVAYSLLGVGGYARPSDRLRQMSSTIDELAVAKAGNFDQGGFEILLPKFGHRQASDPRDKIYSILKIVSDDLQVLPDYTKSVQTVYTDLVKTWISTQRTLDILMCRPIGESNVQGLPTWALDWTQNFHPFDPVATQAPAGFVNETGHAKNEVSKITIEHLDSPQDHLLLSGFAYSKVARTVDDIPNSHYLTEEWQHLVRAWEPKHVNKARLSLQSQRFDVYPQAWTHQPDPLQEARLKYWHVLTAYSRTLLFSSVYNSSSSNVSLSETINTSMKHVKDVPVKETHEYSRWVNYIERVSGGEEIGSSDEEAVELLPFISSLRQATIGRKLCALDSGDFALAPNATKVGDFICVLMGGRVPFILRPIGGLDNSGLSSSLQVKLIGPCYVEGLVVAEELRRGRISNAELLNFSIL